jgi:uncharacterized protein (DUF1697 family)
MPRYFAFLRAVNVGGHVVKMDHLRRLFEALGFSGVETFIASGNVIFETASADAQSLEKQIEAALAGALGYEVATFIRTGAELAGIAGYQPFPQADLEAAAAFNIAFLKEALDAGAVQKLMALRTEIDDFRVHNREVYWLCRMKQSQSTFSNAVLEKALRGKSTLRGVQTIQKMVEKYAGIKNLT